MSIEYARSKRKYFIYPSVQVYLVTVYLLFFLCGGLFILGSVYWLISDLAYAYSFDEAMRLQYLLGVFLLKSGVFIFWALMGAAILCVPLGIMLSHKIAGPLFVFRRQLQAIASAESFAKVSLRKEDFLVDLMEELNSLTDQLARGKKE